MMHLCARQSEPVITSARLFLHAGRSIYRVPGHADLSAVLPPCIASLAGHEEFVEAVFLLVFFFFSLVYSSSSFLLAPGCLALWHRGECAQFCTTAVIFSISLRCRTNSVSAWRRPFPLQDSAGTRPARS